MRMLGRGVPLDQVDKVFSNVAFIVFNYDRCIEHFLFHALQYLYAIKAQRAAELMRSLTIIHPYGTIGDLPFMGSSQITFGGEGERLSEAYFALSARIRTYTEQIKDPTELNAAREQVDLAERIVFLGFAFHDQNLKLIQPTTLIKRKALYGTAYGMSQSDIQVITEQLRLFFDEPGRLTFHPLFDVTHTCSGLFDFYTKSLPA